MSQLGGGGAPGAGGILGSGGASGAGGATGAGGRIATLPGDLAYCDDYARWPEQEQLCGADGDCPAGQRCSDTWFSEPCTLGCAAQQVGCFDVAECQPGEICAPQRVTRPLPPAIVPLPAVPVCDCGVADTGRRCVAPCGTTGCSDDERCGADGVCVLLRCDAGEYDCPGGTVCEAGAAEHGCRALTCAEAGGAACPDNAACVHADTGSYCAFTTCQRSSECDCGTCREVPGAGLHGEPSSVFQCRGRPGICVPASSTYD